jgi:hypothetical protein
MLEPVKIDTHESGGITKRYHVKTVADALALVKKANAFHVHARHDAMLDGDTGHYRPGYYSGCAELTKAAMIKYINDVLSTDDSDKPEYMPARLYCYSLPGRMNYQTGKQGRPRKRVTLYLG